MVSTDSLETLRRKFLRQNRDIARVNSTQSLKIRSLENECVRLLSENLDLRGQILRLQTELEDNKAQRIADHALDIKEKMEAQLAEWGAMLAGLGHEPTPKSRSPRSAKKAKHRSSIGRTSMSEWKRRDTMSSMQDLEAAAAQEGRLPPIWENKPCPRETLGRDEIMALRSIVDDTDSPDLGPPPVLSSFVDEDPVKIDLPARLVPKKSDYASLEKTSSEPQTKREPPAAPKVDEKNNEQSIDFAKVMNDSHEARTRDTTEPSSPNQSVKAGLKRKSREEDEKENEVVSKQPVQTTSVAKNQPEKTASLKARPISNRPIKLPANRKDIKEKTGVSTAPRKPLSAKSSNEFLKSPKKAAKPPMLDEAAKEEPRAKKNPPPIEIPVPKSPQPVPVANVDIETETPTTEPNLAVPETPESMQRDDVRDTPPPADISSRETSRGSRRARAAVSYAEPNLRDKMRRPSKQLLDAVSGEGKQIRRTSHSKKDEFSSAPSSAIKSEEKPMSWKELPAVASASKATPDAMASPLARKNPRSSPSDDLPTTVVMDRRKRNSAMTTTLGAADAESSSSSSGGALKSSSGRTSGRRVDEVAAREAEVAKIFHNESDIYDMPHSSPIDDSKNGHPPDADEILKKSDIRGARKSRSRRLSSMVREDLDMDPEYQPQRQQHHEKSRPTRRVTMTASRESKLDLESTAHDNSMEGDSLGSSSSAEADAAARDRTATRRRSMMI